MKYILTAAYVLIFSVAVCQAQKNFMQMSPDQQNQATLLAQKTLGDLVQMAGQIDVKTIGFDNADQVREAMLGYPISDYMVRLNELKEYRPGMPAARLIHATGRLAYPLEINRRVKSMVTLAFAEERWVVESFGGANQAKMVTELRSSLAGSEGRSEKELFQVRIPALQLMFVGGRRDLEIYLAPLFDMPAYGLEKGKKYRAEMVLENLIQAARTHNGLPT